MCISNCSLRASIRETVHTQEEYNRTRGHIRTGLSKWI
uniref:Uncharacterized protein n=1 Tax=Arundo donax TaxID=35708 RepID=A0A0A9A089_ARUDO